ncbi:uncharacterized protein J8A68_000262 [[Candida] subhashii]|uniref:LisH domain-containing protein n=1 Tax=[Candida] subhashii TaxID=561895 RepID=A0A8J5QWW4_9ASCO|nr:uncharacterized protein J8A68_000262 [[Candida] subhashii]KAG7666202.1 hypothetical protein J8A68_000262 [[Candida] subhashii]
MTSSKSSSSPSNDNASTSLMYIIPPYLLNTCKGSILQQQQQQLFDNINHQLNIITKDSPYYYKHPQPTPTPKPKKQQQQREESILKSKPSPHEDAPLKHEPAHTFSDDPILNDIIKEKIAYKLSIIGVLGDNPMELVDDQRIYEMFQIFKSRIMGEDDETEAGVVNDLNLESNEQSKQQQIPPSIFHSPKIGEASFINDELSKRYKKYLSMNLKDLIGITNCNLNHSKYKLPPSFIKFEKGEFFKYPLPISWIPLIPNPYLNQLEQNLALKIDNQDGYSNILMSATTSHPIEDSPNSYYNFITDKPISCSTGVFYYEIEVQQTLAESTNFKPLISMNDSSINSISSLNLAAGFSKRFINLEGVSPPTTTTTAAVAATSSIAGLGRIDLEKIKNDIIYSESDEDTITPTPSTPIINSDLNILLRTKPGEFRGSFAVSFEDSTFYNSAKNAESLQRQQVINMNRRVSAMNRSNINDIDSGKIDIGIPFKTKIVNNNNNNGVVNGDSDNGGDNGDRVRIHRTDTIGCGINFIDKSMFITLNGVLARVISEGELTAMSSTQATTGASAAAAAAAAAGTGASTGANQTKRSVNNLFYHESNDKEKDNPIYPMIGFKINDIEVNNNQEFEPSNMKITTNFGFKEFKFNMNNYINNFKHENQKFLYLSLLDKIQSNKLNKNENEIENALLNINEDSAMLNKLIKGYLNHQGYINTFKAFNQDLQDLTIIDEKERESDNNNNVNDEEDVLIKSHAYSRQVIKQFIMNKQFDELLEFLELNYGYLMKTAKGGQILFEIKLIKYIELLKVYLEYKLRDGTTENEIYHQVIEYRRLLLLEYEQFEEKINKINEVSSILLISNTKMVDNQLKSIFVNSDKQLNKLQQEINNVILKSIGYKKYSNLEMIFDNVNKNINTLSLDYNDDKFMLINFQKDHIDL